MRLFESINSTRPVENLFNKKIDSALPGMNFSGNCEMLNINHLQKVTAQKRQKTAMFGNEMQLRAFDKLRLTERACVRHECTVAFMGCLIEVKSPHPPSWRIPSLSLCKERGRGEVEK